MHICFICNEYPPAKHGGIGSFTYDLATGLLSRGWKVTVVGIYSKVILELNKDIIEHINGIRVVRLIGLTRLGVRLAHIWDRYRLTQWLHKDHRKQHYDIIEAPDYQGWTAFGIPKDIPLLVRLHGSTMYYDAELHRRSSRLTKLFEKNR